MIQKIKIDGEWRNIVAVYKKINGQWQLQNQYDFDNIAYFYNNATVDVDTLLIIAEGSYTGMQFYVIAKFNNTTVTPTWSITSGNQYATIDNNGKVTILQGADNSLITVNASYNELSDSKSISVTFQNPLRIIGQSTLTGELGNVVALYNNRVVNPVWSITSGNAYATISQFGEISIISDGTITVQAEYQNCVVTKTINVIYETDQESQTTVDPETGAITNTETSTSTDPETGATIETTTTTTTNTDGSSSESTSETTTNTDGSTETSTSTINYDENGDQTSSTETTTTVSAPDPTTGAVTTQESTSTTNPDGTSSESTSTVVEHTDGSSTSNSSVTNYDENGDPTGSTTNTTQNNADGSSQSSTTNFDENGDPTDQQNQEIDTTGNVNTQDVEYENGSPVVTGYTIDTTASEGEGKTYDEDGVNTDYYGFDLTHGFILNIHFTIDFTDQPANQNENHHNILTMKRASPSPWYGFQLRHSSTNKLIIIGTQFATGSNTNTNIQPSWVANNKIGEYNLTITYNPLASTNKFVCYNEITRANVYTSNNNFPDSDDLKYLRVTIGYAMDEFGHPYRYSNINLQNFSIQRT